jgi:hypothetical protein
MRRPAAAEETRGLQRTPRRLRNWLPYAVPVLLLLALRALLPACPCDDAYISFRVAQNTALGKGMVFNPGEPIYVSTSPLWVLLLAGLRFVVGDVPLAARILGVLSEGLLLIAMVHYGRRSGLGTTAALLAAVLLVTNPVFLLTSFSGMELPLFLFALLLIAHLVRSGRFTAAAACAACTLWIRFDGLVILGVTLAGILAAALWSRRRDLPAHLARPLQILRIVAPALAIALGYVAFGLLVFGDWIPMSVRQKALTAPVMFSHSWSAGSLVLAREFGNALLGRSAYWYTGKTPFVFMLLPLVAGLLLHIMKKSKTLLPLAALCGAYVLAYLATGSAYAMNFPWYFVPVLPPAYLLCGSAVAWLLDAVSRRSTVFLQVTSLGLPQAALMLIWLALAFPPLYQDAARLKSVFTDEREQAYASAAVWAGQHLGAGATVAANEIGTVGFFLPAGCSVLDMYGLLRTRSTLEEPYLDLVRRQRPECILSRRHFPCQREIENAMPSRYAWFRFRTLDIGLRADLRARLEPLLHELPRIYATLDINREYAWDQPRGSRPSDRILR